MAAAAIIAGPHDVRMEREPGGPTLRASHDGYAGDCGVIHTRFIRLSADGRALDGEDTFRRRMAGHFGGTGDEFAIRFHLHPAIKASRLADGRGVMLLLQDRELWTFADLGRCGRTRGKRVPGWLRTARAAPCRS